MDKTGVLLVNLGTPEGSDVASVRRYLKEFLSDPRVIDLPALVRWVLTRLIIIPFRAKSSAHAYQSIWTEQGSPLMVHGNALRVALQQSLGERYRVALAMRYGKPNIADGLKSLQEQCSKLIVVPLYPQYSSAASGSVIESVMKVLASQWNMPEQVTVLGEFYQQKGFIEAWSSLISAHLQDKTWDGLLLSYHGLPQRHIERSACPHLCQGKQACPSINADNRQCYRAQCYQTSDLLASALGLAPEQYSTAFQSRLGKTPWITPYFEDEMSALRKRGVKCLAVACPSFVADCLETLEEIGIRGKEQWQALGGESFITLPCLNAAPVWLEALSSMVSSLDA